MRLALRRADRHAVGGRDLVEGVAGGVLEQHDPRLLGGHGGERLAQLTPQLGHVGGRVELLRQRLVAAAPIEGVAARIEDEPVQPRGEARVTAELREPDAYLRHRLLRGIARVVGIAHHVECEPLDPG